MAGYSYFKIGEIHEVRGNNPCIDWIVLIFAEAPLTYFPT